MNFLPCRSALLLLSAVALAWIGGCAAGPATTGDRVKLSPPAETRASENRASERTARPSEPGSASTIALLLDGEPIGWDTLRPLLAEAAGSEVVEELALEHALRRELSARGVSIGDAEISAAREHWLSLLEESRMSVEAETEIRRRRGLGRERFAKLLWRNAALRALLDPAQITVTESEVGLTREVRTGRRYLVTGVIASDARGALRIAGGARTDPGGAVAGLWKEASSRDLVPFRAAMSQHDPAYPESVRRALASLPVGQPSAAIAVDNGYAVVIVEAVLEPSGVTVDDAALRRELTIRKTRVAMERLARELVDRTNVSRLDRSLP